MSKQPDFAGKIIFVEDYDANIARHLVAGVDLWLNNPRRPLEASGTSGQKAGLNGVPNFSVLDGWWREGYDGHNGWAIGAEREYPTEAAQDEADALSLYSTLEEVIVPLFYERDIISDLPEGWLTVMRSSIATVAPDFSFDRMLKEYVYKFYLPAGDLGRRVDGPNYAGARALAAWEDRVLAGWDQVALTAAGPARGEMSVGDPLEVRATLQPGPLDPDDLAVELVFGQMTDGNLVAATVVPMRRVGGAPEYVAAFDSPESGVFTYGVRVRPHHVDLPNPFALSLVKWA
jgi:starch phosphorylase